MKALTGLPTSAYLKIAEEAGVQLSELLQLVSTLESGLLPPYIARYRPDVSAGLDAEQIQEIHTRLRYFLDLEDRRITILTAVGQKNKLTDELRKRIESAVDRRELEDLYLPFREKPKSAADEASEKDLEPLARFLWDQDPPTADIEKVAQSYTSSENGLPGAADALRGARQIVARWLGEDAEIRSELRKLAMDESLLVVDHGGRWRADASLRKKFDWLSKHRSPVSKVTWRHHLALRRAVREDALRYELVLPENKTVVSLLERLLRDRRSAFCLHLGAAARQAYQSYLAPTLQNDVWQALSDRCDTEAFKVFKKNLRKTLMAPPAGPIKTIGIETGRPGGWRAAVVDAKGRLVEAAIVHRDQADKSQAGSNGVDGSRKEQNEQQERTEEPASNESQPPAQAKEQGDASAPANGAGSGNTNPEKSGSASEQQPEPKPEQQAAGGEPAAKPSGDSSGAQSTQDVKPSEAAENAPEATQKQASEKAETGKDIEPKPAASEAQQSPAKSTESSLQTTRGAAAVPDVSLAELIKKYEPEAIVFSNGRKLRQVERWVRSAVREAGAPKIFWTTVTEGGTWIYATSKAGKRDLPGVEPAVRSAVSLARRLQDPLAELIKVDPKLLGIGQYHSEVDASRLRAELRSTTETCVQEVGVDLNEAPADLLTCVPGITPRVAKRIFAAREKSRFSNREQLKKVPGINDRLYRQAVGFLRIYGGDNVLDTTGVHPESYPVVEKLLSAAGVSAEEALEKPEVFDSLNLDEFVDEKCPKEMLQAIVKEFRPPARNPRPKFVPPQPPVDLKPAGDIKVGSEVEGIVTNVADFGAFVDIGADQDGLVHNSQLSDKFRENGKPSLKAGDRISVRILAVEKDSSRISLTTKDRAEVYRELQAARAVRQRQRPSGPRPQGQRRRRKGPDREVSVSKRTFGPDPRDKARESEKLSKLSLDEKLSLLKSKYRTKV